MENHRASLVSDARLTLRWTRDQNTMAHSLSYDARCAPGAVPHNATPITSTPETSNTHAQALSAREPDKGAFPPTMDLHHK